MEPGRTVRTKVAVVGLGRMGSALADALIARGFDVTVWNRSPAKSERFAKAGVRVAPSVAEAARACDQSVVCLVDHAATMASVATEDVAASLRGKILLQLSTITSAESIALDKWAQKNGVAYLDGQIVAFPEEVRAAQGAIVCSGPRITFKAIETTIAAMTGEVVFLGEVVGAAPAYDKAALAYYFSQWVAFIHAAALCAAGGVPMDVFVERMSTVTLIGGSKDHSLDRYGRMVAARSYDRDIEASLNVFAGTLEMVLRQCKTTGIEPGHLLGIKAFMDRAISMGHGQHDLGAIIEAIEKGRS